jgi:DNA modification methylase
MQVTMKPIDEVKPYYRNPRKNDEAVDGVVAAIKEFGWRQPIVVDKEGVIVVGHTRLKAAKKLGLTEVPVHVATELTPEQCQAYRLADNKTGEKAVWDYELLQLEMADLAALDFDMGEFGFNMDVFDADELQDGQDEEGGALDNIPSDPKTKVGDIYALGKHRLMCGDCCDPEHAKKLMAGDKAKILFTSPPYSDLRTYGGDCDLSPEHLSAFIFIFEPYADYQCVNLGLKKKDNDIDEYWNTYIKVARESGYKLMAWNVWDKGSAMSLNCMNYIFPLQHEFIFIFGKEYLSINKTELRDNVEPKDMVRVKRKNADGFNTGNICLSSSGDTHKKVGSVMLIPCSGEQTGHPAPFPISLPREYITAMTNRGDIVIEPFAGSGTTIMACEELKRICYATEINPAYCDIIISRWEKLTGKKAILQESTQSEANNEHP